MLAAPRHFHSGSVSPGTDHTEDEVVEVEEVVEVFFVDVSGLTVACTVSVSVTVAVDIIRVEVGVAW